MLLTVTYHWLQLLPLQSQGLVIASKSLARTFNDYEERVDNLSALPGLAGNNLEWLSQKAKELRHDCDVEQNFVSGNGKK
jgi:hypothetical protein